MRIDITTYLGPYFECKYQVTQKDYSYRACTNRECFRHSMATSQGKYCIECGSPIEKVPYMKWEPTIDEDAVREELNDEYHLAPGDELDTMMANQKVHVWLENKREPTAGVRFDPETESMWETYDPERIAQELLHFTASKTKELEILRKFYGDDNVKVKWGLLNMIH